MKNNHSFVSIIIPCRNEEKYIAKCLNSIVRQDYLLLCQGFGGQAKDNLEVLVVDGMSEDRTREILGEYIGKYPFIRILDNPRKFTNFAWNIGVKKARGEIVILMGAHAGYKKDYISKCVKYLKEYNADNVGGAMKTLPSKNTLWAKAIAFCLSSFFGAGGSWFRTGAKKPRWVDTVFGGCYKREVFNRIGLFNENLLRSEDMEFNLRLKKAGGKILLVPDIVSYYYPKSNLKDFFRHNFEDGIWAILPLKFVKTPLKLRHYIPLIFVLTLPLSVWPYIPISSFFSLKIAIREKDIKLFFVMPLVFFSRHFAYGLGSIWGLIKIVVC